MQKFVHKNRLLIGIGIVLFLLLFLTGALHERFQNDEIYNRAINQIEKGEYQKAIDELQPLRNFKETQKYIEYAKAFLLLDTGYPKDAAEILQSLGDFENSYEKAREIINVVKIAEEQEQLYQQAVSAYQNRQYRTAVNVLEQLGDYKDSQKIEEEVKVILWRLEQAHTITAGIQCSAGVTQSGKVLFSGQHFAGEDDIEKWENIVSVSASNEFLIGLQNDGTVVTAKRKPHYGYRIDTTEWKNMIAVSAGEQFIVGLREDGTLTAQGIDGYGETNIDEWKDIVDVDTGWQHTVGLDQYGRVHAVGIHSEELMREIAENQDSWSNIVDISTGGSTAAGSMGNGHIVGLKDDGTVVAVGDNTYGQCNVSDWSDVVAIDAGDYHTVGLRSNGTVLTTQTGDMFRESSDQISQWNDMVAVAAGYGFTLGLREDGTVKAAGLNKNGQCNVADWGEIQNSNEWVSNR